jgi:hypothetical protein
MMLQQVLATGRNVQLTQLLADERCLRPQSPSSGNYST